VRDYEALKWSKMKLLFNNNMLKPKPIMKLYEITANITWKTRENIYKNIYHVAAISQAIFNTVSVTSLFSYDSDGRVNVVRQLQISVAFVN